MSTRPGGAAGVDGSSAAATSKGLGGRLGGRGRSTARRDSSGDDGGGGGPLPTTRLAASAGEAGGGAGRRRGGGRSRVETGRTPSPRS